MWQVEQGEHRHFYIYERCEVHWCRTAAAAAAAVVPLLYCADVLEIQSKCGLELSLVVFRMARHTRTHRSTVRSCHKMRALKYGYSCTVAATTSKARGVIQAHSSSNSSRQYSKNDKRKKKAQGHLCSRDCSCLLLL